MIPKPIYVYFTTKPKSSHKDKLDLQKFSSDEKSNVLLQEEPDDGHAKDNHDDHGGFGEILIHQVIETIEFVLGSISNTASYLRLWALSLAHAQLASVFFKKTLLGSIQSGKLFGVNIIFKFKIIIGFYFFAMVTAGVLMSMDLMECFLHTLRLHW